MTTDKQTINFYDKEALNYSLWSSKHDNLVYIKQFTDLVSAKGHILDLGCGSGWATNYFLKKKI